MQQFRTTVKIVAVTTVIALISACPNPRPTPNTNPGTFTIAAGTFNPPNLILNGPIPGCADAAELVGQTVVLPAMPFILDAQGIVDRVDTSAGSATYTYSIRPVNPFDCSSTRLPASPPTTITFGFNYSGDFSRTDPLCMNASTVALTGFSVTGTPIDALIEPIFHGILWLRLDNLVADGLHPLHIGGSRPADADPRCSNWVDQTTL